MYTQPVKTHDLKTWPEPFQATWDGIKLYEFRRNDRDFQVGDLLMLREWAPNGRNPGYTDRYLKAEVVYVTEPPAFGLQAGFVIMGLRRLVFGR